jgi:DNA-binding NarL/FixJ family response regulator
LADDLIRVMTVDHQALFRAAARELIAATDGFEPVLEVASGEEALEWAAQKDPQLVLVDVRMPGMSGIETCRRLIARDSSIIVVLITSDESEAVPKEAQESGAVALLAKQHLSRAVLRGLWAIHGPVR